MLVRHSLPPSAVALFPCRMDARLLGSVMTRAVQFMSCTNHPLPFSSSSLFRAVPPAWNLRGTACLQHRLLLDFGHLDRVIYDHLSCAHTLFAPSRIMNSQLNLGGGSRREDKLDLPSVKNSFSLSGQQAPSTGPHCFLFLPSFLPPFSSLIAPLSRKGPTNRRTDSRQMAVVVQGRGHCSAE